MKTFDRNNLILSSITAISIVLFYLSDIYQIFGRAFNYFFPCVQSQTDSFPCYAIIDIWAMGALIIIGLFSLVFLIVNMLKNNK
jgi:hypothetical protein